MKFNKRRNVRFMKPKRTNVKPRTPIITPPENPKYKPVESFKPPRQTTRMIIRSVKVPSGKFTRSSNQKT